MSITSALDEPVSRSPILVVNVALDNWRALHKLGYTRLFVAAVVSGSPRTYARQCMSGDYRPPLDPDQADHLHLLRSIPADRTPDRRPGASVGRAKMFATSYRDYEMQIRQQMVKLFASAGL